MGNCASRASFIGTGGTSRTIARIFSAASGGGFKLNSTVSDVENQGFDATGKPGPVRPAKKMLMTTGTQIEADLTDGAAWAETKVRVRCADGSWSDWIAVAK